MASRAARPPGCFLILTTFDLDEYVYEALRAGASGFVLTILRNNSSRRSAPSPPGTRCSRRRSRNA
jgi:hypothetical protein